MVSRVTADIHIFSEFVLALLVFLEIFLSSAWIEQIWVAGPLLLFGEVTMLMGGFLGEKAKILAF